MNIWTFTSVFGKASKAGAWPGRFFKRSAKSSRFLATSGPYEGERKRFRSEGDFLVRALVDVLSQCRFQIGRLECELAELEKLTAEQKLPREVLQALRQLARRPSGVGLSEQELRQRLDQLQELHILPEHRVQPGLNSDGVQGTTKTDGLKRDPGIC